MARIARVVVPGIPHHVTQRGNRKQQTFFCDGDYRAYMRCVAGEKERANAKIWAYCLMPNHVHFVVVPEHRQSLAMLFKESHRKYTRRINVREGWCGHLWQGRVYSFGVTVEALERHGKTGRPAGDAQFIKKLETITGRALAKQKPGRKAKIKYTVP